MQNGNGRVPLARTGKQKSPYFKAVMGEAVFILDR